MKRGGNVFSRRLILSICCFLKLNILTAQEQTCPENINFALGNLTHWSAYVGHYINKSGAKSVTNYDTSSGPPSGTIGVVSLDESLFPVLGIQVLTANGVDQFGGFSTIPTINGYNYTNTVLLGSTTVSPYGGVLDIGLVRGISYNIMVPPGASSEPYTMTYTYAMVLENGTHIANEQPMAKATLSYQDSIITCASPYYYLPTVSPSGGAVDVTAANLQGFTLSSVPSPNPGNPGETPYRVWTKNWTEVTVDLSGFRGKMLTLNFEADNCVPSGHFAYAYFAIRNNCSGLVISGPSVACRNSEASYSIPALENATYQWSYPSGWSVVSDSANILRLIPGNDSGTITAQETNNCANMQAVLNVSNSLPTVAGVVSGNSNVCAGTNATTFALSGFRGNILNWLSSNNSTDWNVISDTDTFYTAANLSYTTFYKAIVQNGPACSIDSTNSVVVKVVPQTVPGILDPSLLTICRGQNKNASIILSGAVGNVLNWQSSLDSINWSGFNPVDTDTVFNITNVDTPTIFRAIVQSGICPADTSSLTQVNIQNALFPQATLNPADVYVCFNQTGILNADVTTGTSYEWKNSDSLTNFSDTIISYTPYTVSAVVNRFTSADYILAIQNAGCSNVLLDTFHVTVFPPLIVNAGPDTFIVANQPLQLVALASDTSALSYEWTPESWLSKPSVNNPVSLIGPGVDTITYSVTATSQYGCTGSASKKLTIFNTGPNIFVPSAFTPNNDGLNDILKAIPVGIKTFDYFSIYNRWGQLLFSTSDPDIGWDGTFGGQLQSTGTFVYMAQGMDYLGNPVFRKGTVVLIR